MSTSEPAPARAAASPSERRPARPEDGRHAPSRSGSRDPVAPDSGCPRRAPRPARSRRLRQPPTKPTRPSAAAPVRPGRWSRCSASSPWRWCSPPPWLGPGDLGLPRRPRPGRRRRGRPYGARGRRAGLRGDPVLRLRLPRRRREGRRAVHDPGLPASSTPTPSTGWSGRTPPRSGPRCEAEVKASGVAHADADRVNVLLYVNQSTTSTANSGQPQVALNRVQLSMVRQGGTWLVNDITSY